MIRQLSRAKGFQALMIEVTETMQILEAQGIEKVQDMDEVIIMQIDESLTIPELEQVSMVGA